MRKKILISLLVLLISSSVIANPTCFRKRKPTVVHDTIVKTEYVDRLKIDSVYIDKYHDRYISGDTVYLKDSIFINRYKYQKDTINITDTIVKNVEVPVTKTEIKKVYLWWPSILILLIAGGILFYLNKKFKWIK